MPVKRRSASPPPPPPPDRDLDTESRILDAAHTVFLLRGTAGARMADIAREAGVNQALLHYYFRSKERLAEAVFGRAAVRLLPPVVAILASDLDLESKVERVVAHELEQLAATPHLPAYILAELNHHPERSGQLMRTLTGLDPSRVRPDVFVVLGRQITERVRAGTMRPIGVEQFAVNLIALCVFPFAARPMLMTLAGWDAAGFSAFIEERKRTLPAFFLNALRP